MTTPDPKPTAPPTVAPASDAEIAAELADIEREGRCSCSVAARSDCAPHTCSDVLALIARIESDRAENDRLRLEAIENAHDYANSLMAHKRKDRELSELRQKLEDMYARVEKTCSDSLEYRTKFAKL